MNTEANKQRFIGLCETLIKRDGISDLMKYLENSDFYTAPASTRFHLAEPGGLLTHSLNVYDQLLKLLDTYPEVKLSDESAAIMALFHDLCKANMYTPEKRNRKNSSGQWEQYDSYTINEKFHYGGHGSKSVFMLQNYIRLTPEEAVAINCHMGAWDGNKDVGSAYEQFTSAWLLHVADEAACYLMEAKQSDE